MVHRILTISNSAILQFCPFQEDPAAVNVEAFRERQKMFKLEIFFLAYHQKPTKALNRKSFSVKCATDFDFNFWVRLLLNKIQV